jgi:hypothetical protein
MTIDIKTVIVFNGLGTVMSTGVQLPFVSKTPPSGRLMSFTR